MQRQIDPVKAQREMDQPRRHGSFVSGVGISAVTPQVRAGTHPNRQQLYWRLDGRAASPESLLILALHGLGMEEDTFSRLLSPLLEHDLQLLVPRAPLAAVGGGASWYDYDGDPERFRLELERTEELLLEFIRGVERHYDLKPRRRVLLGFSQGGYCGAYVALRNPTVFRGMIISGARVKTEILEADMKRAARSGFRVLLCHGERDRAVSVEGARASHAQLQAAGLDVDLQIFDSGHLMSRGELAVIGDWLCNLHG